MEGAAPMRVVVPMPDAPYYLWQALVQAAHMEKLGMDDVHYLVYYSFRPSLKVRKMAEALPATFHFYEDSNMGQREGYDPAMKPLLVGLWMAEDRERENVPFLYLDPDAVLTRVPASWPAPWHASDTDSYVGPDYIRSKGDELFIEMCRIVGVDPKDAVNASGIGAQYIIGGTTAEFWRRVALDSVRVYHLCLGDTSDHPIQAWCAEMYVTWMAAVRDGLDPRADESMKFMWANHDLSGWSDPDTMFYHNAGVIEENGEHFCKLSWQSSPFRSEIAVSSKSASRAYVDLIREAEECYPDLIW